MADGAVLRFFNAIPCLQGDLNRLRILPWLCIARGEVVLGALEQPNITRAEALSADAPLCIPTDREPVAAEQRTGCTDG
jgi:hypothetical protein